MDDHKDTTYLKESAKTYYKSSMETDNYFNEANIDGATEIDNKY